MQYFVTIGSRYRQPTCFTIVLAHLWETWYSLFAYKVNILRWFVACAWLKNVGDHITLYSEQLSLVSQTLVITCELCLSWLVVMCSKMPSSRRSREISRRRWRKPNRRPLAKDQLVCNNGRCFQIMRYGIFLLIWIQTTILDYFFQFFKSLRYGILQH